MIQLTDWFIHSYNTFRLCDYIISCQFLFIWHRNSSKIISILVVFTFDFKSSPFGFVIYKIYLPLSKMETKQDYQSRAQFILKKAFSHEPQLTEKIGSFYWDLTHVLLWLTRRNNNLNNRNPPQSMRHHWKLTKSSTWVHYRTRFTEWTWRTATRSLWSTTSTFWRILSKETLNTKSLT